MLYIRFVNLITGSLYLWTNISPFLPLPRPLVIRIPYIYLLNPVVPAAVSDVV